MKMNAAVAICAASLFAMTASATMSTPTRLISAPESSLHWRTYLAVAEGFSWDWPKGSNSARLTTSGKGGVETRVFNRTVSAFAPTIPAEIGDEDVLDLTLEFFASADASGDAMSGETLTASGIGIVRGVGGASLDFRAASDADRKWSEVEARSAVLPVPDGTTELSLDGVQITPDAVPGWHLWARISPGHDYIWTATDGSASYVATLRRISLGTFIIVR